jgi:asparagine N-glycosylation enzyme membrane subunit Stt3
LIAPQGKLACSCGKGVPATEQELRERRGRALLGAVVALAVVGFIALVWGPWPAVIALAGELVVLLFVGITLYKLGHRGKCLVVGAVATSFGWTQWLS